ncbi:MAG: HEAT repeat domain-containing protein, partial [Gemmatimonadetes bacterium]|nr:HEAT repeat domain-containing protein [Gemmatimonadota bacterium]
AVSQSDDPANGQWLVDIATDRSQPMDLRKNALFWAGQSGEGLADLLAMWSLDLDQEMKGQLVFVYSQSGEPAALDKLFEIARTETDKELRENAIFWLGQSDDPRVTAFLEELINN